MYCPACGSALPPEVLFCGFCGFRLEPMPNPFLESPQTPPSPPASSEPIPLTQRKRRKELGLDLPAQPESEVRRHPRFPLRVEINYESDNNFYTGVTENISHGGLFIATHNPRAMGEMIEITLTLPGMQHAFQLLGRVKWVREYNANVTEGTPGMGIEFANLGERERRLIEAFIRHREPIFFDT